MEFYKEIFKIADAEGVTITQSIMDDIVSTNCIVLFENLSRLNLHGIYTAKELCELLRDKGTNIVYQNMRPRNLAKRMHFAWDYLQNRMRISKKKNRLNNNIYYFD